MNMTVTLYGKVAEADTLPWLATTRTCSVYTGWLRPAMVQS